MPRASGTMTNHGLKRDLGFLGVFSVASGAMISSGLFVLPGIAYEEAGAGIVFSYALASILVIPVLLSMTELATAMPKSGGTYFFIERSLGPMVGTFAGFANWLSVTLKATFALVGIGTIVTGGVEDWRLVATAIGACLFFSVFNLVSTKGTGRLQVALVAGLLVILVAYIVGGFTALDPEHYNSSGDPSWGWWQVYAVAGMVFVSFGGLTKVVGISEEVRDPSRNLPLGMFLAYGVVSVLYVLVVFVTIGVLDPGVLRGSLVPISRGAEAVMGTIGLRVIAVGAALAFATTANSGILTGSRSPMAMSRDGLLPEFFARTNRRFGTPHWSILLTSVCCILVILLLSVEDLVKTASAMILLTFMMVNFSVVILRKSPLQNYRPTFRAPFCPWLQALSVIIYGFLIVEMGTVPLLFTGVFGLISLFWYLTYIRFRIERESAIVYLVKSIVSKEFRRSNLEDELKQITLERDEIVLDRFDELAKNAVVLDFEAPMSGREFFGRVAESLAHRLKMDPERIYSLFLKRERETSTVVAPGLAIPHIVVEGEKVFELALIRAREGVSFSDLHAPVKTAFILIGSPDERNYHLRALMHIAHIVQEPDFERRWEAASGIEGLRDVVLLSRRKRDV